MSTLHLFAGAGGWEEGFSTPDDIGIDNWGPACATAEMAGHKRVKENILKLDPRDYLDYEGITGGPPCQSFSISGDGGEFNDPRGLLSLEPLKWAKVIRPKFIALEQVVEIMWYWRQVAKELQAMGYYTWVGQLNCANFGVPQDRYRAVLLASRARKDIQPKPAQYRSTLRDFFPEREGYVMESVNNSGRKMPDGTRRRGIRELGQPAFTLTGKCFYNKWIWRETGRPYYISQEECSVMQGFRADYPWQGLKAQRQQQIGNSIPPPLARHLLELLHEED